MEKHTPSLIKFMKDFPRHEPVIIDSTAMMTYKACPRQYFYRMVLGFVPKEDKPYFAFGSAYHLFREKLEHYTKNQKQPMEAFKDAALDGLMYLKKHLPPVKEDDKWSFLNETRLKKSMEVAFTNWLLEKRNKRIEVIAYEQPFTLQLPDGTWIAGRADQIVKWNGKLWGRDFKTSSQMSGAKPSPFYQRGLEPNDQFTRYTYAESILQGWDCNSEVNRVQGQIIEALFNSKTNGPVIETYTTTRTLAQLKRWELEHGFWKDMIESSREKDLYPMNEKSCNFCPYHSVCKTPSEAAQMHELRTFYRTEPWDCTRSDEA
jgi:CRISPR/Cas system-associated exonuclease Cas4 (RecB family)